MSIDSEYTTVNFWELSPETVARVCLKPTSWYEEAFNRAVKYCSIESDPRKLCDELLRLSAYAQMFQVRLMAQNGNMPGRKLRSAESGSGTS